MDSVSFVFQNTRLFKRSLIDNIRFARPSATRAEVEAARARGAMRRHHREAARGLGHGGRREGRLPVGRRMPAYRACPGHSERCAYRGLDEATAFADPENEALIQRALARLTHGKTVLMIAHRLSTVVGADRICVVENGAISESGSHGDLVESKGVYRRMWEDYQKSVSWRIGGVPTMLREKFALTERGAFEFKRGAFFCARQPVMMAPIGVLCMATNDYLDHLLDPSKPLPALGGYLAAIVVILLLMLLTQWLEYHFTYNVVYGESARKRIELAEVLRRLPFPFRKARPRTSPPPS